MSKDISAARYPYTSWQRDVHIHEKNALLTDAERSEKVWKVVGGRGNRHLVLAHVKQSPLA